MEIKQQSHARWRIDDNHTSPLTGPTQALEAILSQVESVIGAEASHPTSPTAGDSTTRSSSRPTPAIENSQAPISVEIPESKTTGQSYRKLEDDLFQREQILYRGWERLAEEERRFRLWMQMKAKELDLRERELEAKELILVHQIQQLGQVLRT